jgi:predicted ATPase
MIMSRHEVSCPPAAAGRGAGSQGEPGAAAGGRAARRGALAGREREIAELRLLCAGRRMVTLTGAAGIGKTSLLRALAAGMASGFAGGAVTADLGDLREPALVPAVIAEAMGICEEPGIPVTDTIAAAVADRSVLLVLDGAGHVAGACARLCDRLLDGAPELRVIAASQQPLGAAAEHAWLVPPLAVPGAGLTDPGRAACFPAVAVLAGRAGPGFVLDADSAGPAVALCRALGGVPMALELAGARLPATGAAAAADAISARLARTRPGGSGPGGDRAGLAAVLEWTHDLLEPAGQVLLRRLSVFAGWSDEIAQRACADAGLPAARVPGLVTALVGAGLAVPEPAAGPGRYRLPGAVRDFAAARLGQAGETAMMRRRLRDYAAGLADYAATIGSGRVPATWPVLPDVCSTFDAPNFRAALEWCLEYGDAEAGLRICTDLRLCWLVRDAWDERSWWLDALMDAGGEGVPADVLGPALAVRAQLAFDADDLSRAQECGLTALGLCRAAGSTRFAAAALDVMARVAVREGRPQDAMRHAEEGIEIARAAGDQWAIALPVGSRTIALTALGRLPEATEAALSGLRLMQELDNQWGMAVYRLGLGNLARTLGDLATARRHYEAALPFARESMGASRAARCLAYLGRVTMRQDDLGPAREYLAESLRLSRACGSRAGTVRALRGLAALALREARPGVAVQLGAAAAALSEAAGLPPPPEGPGWYERTAVVLGAAETTRLRAVGQDLTGPQAAALALEPPAHASSAPGPSGRA